MDPEIPTPDIHTLCNPLSLSVGDICEYDEVLLLWGFFFFSSISALFFPIRK